MTIWHVVADTSCCGTCNGMHVYDGHVSLCNRYTHIKRFPAVLCVVCYACLYRVVAEVHAQNPYEMNWRIIVNESLTLHILFTNYQM